MEIPLSPLRDRGERGCGFRLMLLKEKGVKEKRKDRGVHVSPNPPPPRNDIIFFRPRHANIYPSRALLVFILPFNFNFPFIFLLCTFFNFTLFLLPLLIFSLPNDIGRYQHADRNIFFLIFTPLRKDLENLLNW